MALYVKYETLVSAANYDYKVGPKTAEQNFTFESMNLGPVSWIFTGAAPSVDRPMWSVGNVDSDHLRFPYVTLTSTYGQNLTVTLNKGNTTYLLFDHNYRLNDRRYLSQYRVDFLSSIPFMVGTGMNNLTAPKQKAKTLTVKNPRFGMQFIALSSPTGGKVVVNFQPTVLDMPMALQDPKSLSGKYTVKMGTSLLLGTDVGAMENLNINSKATSGAGSFYWVFRGVASTTFYDKTWKIGQNVSFPYPLIGHASLLIVADGNSDLTVFLEQQWCGYLGQGGKRYSACA
jgi:hypothetical protein